MTEKALPEDVEDIARAAFSNLGHPLAVWSSEGRLRFCNGAFEALFDCFAGGPPRDLLQSRFLEFISRTGLLVSAGSDDTVARAGAPDILSGQRFVLSDGSLFVVEGWTLDAGDLVTLCRDVTEEARNADALVKARDAATEADRTKSRFLRAANHDLRQPLASLKILIYNCIAARNDEERDQALHAMDVSVAIMEDLLGALLNIGQLDAGKIEANVQTFQLSVVLERLRTQFEHQAREKGLTLTILPSRLAIESDRVLLERVLANFIGNAIRYTDVGRVLVGCRRHGRMLRIGVFDTGCGIAPKFHEVIFDEFFRIAEQQGYRQHSLGLGLNIAKRLSQILRHPLGVWSEPGRGSVFSIEVPLGNILHSNVGEPEINERIGGEFAGLSCLVLEDDINLRAALVVLLERWGIDVLTLDTFSDIAASVAGFERQPDIILSDFRLRGGIQGPDVVDVINDLLEKPCPALVMTADTNPEQIRTIRAQGYPVLIKPVSPPGLRVLMHNLLFEPELVPELA